MTGWRNLKLFADLYQASAARVEECLALVELEEAANLPVRAYSLGMRRKLLLARALLHRPRLLYLDEPSANLDIHSTAVVHRILRGLAAEGVAILLTTHNMQEVEEVCDRVAILCRGKIVAQGSPLELRQQHSERKVDVILAGGARLVVDLNRDDERDRLGRHVAAGEIASLRTREFNFREAFLKLTGTEYT
jgi:ABC-2 type transport system ATP-binding protein